MFLAIQDVDGLYWMIPISSKVEKFKAIYKHKTQNGKRCDTIYFANVLGNERAFLIQSKRRYLTPYYYSENKCILSSIRWREHLWENIIQMLIESVL